MVKQVAILSSGFGTRLVRVVSVILKSTTLIKNKSFLAYIIK